MKLKKLYLLVALTFFATNLYSQVNVSISSNDEVLEIKYSNPLFSLEDSKASLSNSIFNFEFLNPYYNLDLSLKNQIVEIDPYNALISIIESYFLQAGMNDQEITDLDLDSVFKINRHEQTYAYKIQADEGYLEIDPSYISGFAMDHLPFGYNLSIKTFKNKIRIFLYDEIAGHDVGQQVSTIVFDEEKIPFLINHKTLPKLDYDDGYANHDVQYNAIFSENGQKTCEYVMLNEFDTSILTDYYFSGSFVGLDSLPYFVNANTLINTQLKLENNENSGQTSNISILQGITENIIVLNKLLQNKSFLDELKEIDITGLKYIKLSQESDEHGYFAIEFSNGALFYFQDMNGPELILPRIKFSNSNDWISLPNKAQIFSFGHNSIKLLSEGNIYSYTKGKTSPEIVSYLAGKENDTGNLASETDYDECVTDQLCFSPIESPLTSNEDDISKISDNQRENDFSIARSMLEESLKGDSTDAIVESLRNIVKAIYFQQKIDINTKEYFEADLAFAKALIETNNAIHESQGYSQSESGLSHTLEDTQRISAASRVEDAARSKLSIAETNLISSREVLFKEVLLILGNIFGLRNNEVEKSLTANTFNIIAETLVELNENVLAQSFYSIAAQVSTSMAEKLRYEMLNLSLYSDEDLENKKAAIENIFYSQLPILQRMARSINDVEKQAEVAYEEAMLDVQNFLSTLAIAQETGDTEAASSAEESLYAKNPRAYYAVVGSLYGEDIIRPLVERDNIEEFSAKFSEETWEQAGYSWDEENITPEIAIGSLEDLSANKILAWQLLYRLASGRAKKYRWQLEKDFDKVLDARLAETNNKLTYKEALLYAGSLGDMLIAATKRFGDFEQMLEAGDDAQKRFEIISNRFNKITNYALGPYVIEEEGNPFYEMEATLALRLYYHGTMALHDYPNAINVQLPFLIDNYGNTETIKANLFALNNLYPQHFSGNCLLIGQDFSKEDIGLEAASREEAMFMTTEEIKYIFINIGAGMGGGVAGCAIAGGTTLVATKNPAFATGACEVGAFVGGGLAAGSMNKYNINKRLREHAPEIQRARQAGISLVSAQEAERYRSGAALSTALEYIFGGFYGRVGLGITKMGLAVVNQAITSALSFDIALTGFDLMGGLPTAERVVAEKAGQQISKSIFSRFIYLPNGTKAIYAGGILMAADYFSIDNISIERKRDDSGKRRTIPSVEIDWDADYHIDTIAGVAGALLLTGGTGIRLIQSPQFRAKFGRFMIGNEFKTRYDPVMSLDAETFKNTFWNRLLVRYGWFDPVDGAMKFAGTKGVISFPFNVIVGNAEKISVPMLVGDFTYQQFVMDEEWFEENGIEKTPQLSIVGGLGLALAAGNRFPIHFLGLRPSGQRLYFISDRILDMYTMWTSGNKNFLEADWARIGLKYTSGWSVGQVRGKALYYSIARNFDNKFVKSIVLKSNGFASASRVFANIDPQERSTLSKLLKYTHPFKCNITVSASGDILRGSKVVASLSAQEQRQVASLLSKGGHTNYGQLFKNGQTEIAIIADAKLNATGLAAFAILHDPVIGTSYDYIRGEYIIFGDGEGYAKWTFYRTPILFPRTMIKGTLGVDKFGAVIVDFLPRMIVDPYITNWTRIYAKSSLWWPHFDDALEGDTDKLMEFMVGDSEYSANGIDSWNSDHNVIPYLKRTLPHKPKVNTFADGYRTLTEKLLDNKMNPENLKAFDVLISELIGEVRSDMENGVIRDNAQERIEHAEILSAVAYTVHHDNPTAFSETFSVHGQWIDHLLGEKKPVSPDDIAELATLIGEYTTIGDKGEIMQPVPFVGSFFKGIDGRSMGYQLDEEGNIDFKTPDDNWPMLVIE
ncbi:MAG: hypothetical protein ABIA04_08760 [Pseudomonadota bacterium]